MFTAFHSVIVHLRIFPMEIFRNLTKPYSTKSSIAILFATVKNKIKVCNLIVHWRGG